jgi:hypothetical protein
MSVATAAALAGAELLRRWFDTNGVPQLEPRDDWQIFARCGAGGYDPEWFMADVADDVLTYAAQTVCALCPVRRQCDQWANDHGAAGVWGGIWRDTKGRPAVVCATAGCLRYRWHNSYRCRACMAEAGEPAARDVREVNAAA